MLYELLGVLSPLAHLLLIYLWNDDAEARGSSGYQKALKALCFQDVRTEAMLQGQAVKPDVFVVLPKDRVLTPV